MMPAFRTMIIAGVLSAVLTSMRLQAQAGPITLVYESISGTASGAILAPIGGGPEPDLLIASPAQNVVMVGIADPGGTTHVFTNLAVAAAPIALAAGDLDGDGDADIVSLNATQASVLLRNGLTAVRTDLALANAASTAITLTDIDADGDLDLLRGTVVRLNNGAGGFSASSTLVTFNGLPGDVLPGDFNGDGMADLLHLSVGANLTADLFPGFAGGVFPPISFSTTVLAQGLYPELSPGVATADMDGDGRDDVVVAAFGADRVSEVRVWRGQPGIGFIGTAPARTATLGLPPSTSRPQVFDADGDLDRDVLVQIFSSYGPHAYYPVSAIARNDGTGQLGVLMSSPIGVDERMVLGDVDLNGFIDCGSMSTPYNGISFAEVFWLLNGGIGTGPQSITLTAISANNQTVNPGQTIALGVSATDGAGNPIVGAYADINAVNAQGLSMPFNAVWATSLNGGAACSFNVGYDGGQMVVSFAMPSATPVVYTVNVLPAVLAAQSGTTQSAVNGTAFPAPLVVRITDASGAGLPYAQIRFTLPSGITFTGWPAGSTEVVVSSDANGFANVSVSAELTALGGVHSVTATVVNSGLPPAVFSLTTSGVHIFTLISGDGQVLDAGDAPAPIVWSVLAPSGLPAVNAPFVVTTTASGGSVTSNVTSDALGNVLFVPTITPGFHGYVSVTIEAPGLPNLPSAPAYIFVRGLSVTRAAIAPLLVINYVHENGPQPLIFAVDAPNIPPTATPYGVIATSILQPQPTLHVYDATGAYGAPDPTLIANPTYSRTATIPAALIGTTWTFQIYGLDIDVLPNLAAAIFISNPVTVTL